MWTQCEGQEEEGRPSLSLCVMGVRLDPGTAQTDDKRWTMSMVYLGNGSAGGE